MEKVYYLYCGISMREILDFIEVIMQSCISYEYDYEAGTITVKNVRDSQIEDLDEYIKQNELDIHDTEENY